MQKIFLTLIILFLILHTTLTAQTEPKIADESPPLPPTQLAAIALDGAVQLRWKNSPDQNTRGYLVYYGTVSDDYLDKDAILEFSPIDAGKKNIIYIDGLKNGTLYYFRVAAYTSHVGELSREVRSRPLQ